MGIKHRADSGFRKFRVIRKLCLGGQVRGSEMPCVSYPRPFSEIPFYRCDDAEQVFYNIEA